VIDKLIKLEEILKLLDKDIGQDYQSLHQRDRDIYDSCSDADKKDDWSLIQYWYAQSGQTFAKLPKWLYAVAALIGFISMVGLLSFSRGDWLNIFWLLFCFTLLPMLGSVVLLWQLLRPSKTPFSLFSPALSILKTHTALPLTPLNASLILQQSFLWFFTGSIIGFLIKITFSDLVFVWQTSLNVDPNHVQQLFSWLARPFSGFMDLTPSITMVENSQFLHLNHQNLSAKAQHWWAFLFMVLITWAVVPRVIILLLTGVKSRLYFKRSLASGQIPQCLDRMKRAIVAIQTQTKESNNTPLIEPAFVNLPDIDLVLYWGEAKITFDLDNSLASIELGQHDWQFDNDAIQRLVEDNKMNSQPKNIIICVIGHESPLADLADLCELLPSESQLFLMVNTNNPLHTNTWQRFINRFLPRAQLVSYEQSNK
jgi:hypothetical protein